MYLLVLAGCLLGTLPLELVLHVGVYRQWLRLLLTLVPVLTVFLAWDALAVRHKQWGYDMSQLLGVTVGNLPLEEIGFFLVIPTCSILAFEAVRRNRREADL